MGGKEGIPRYDYRAPREREESEMCGRYTLKIPVEELAQRFGITGRLPEVAPSYNIAPTQEVLAVGGGVEERWLELLRWGLVPSWAKEPKPGPINARAETVAEKPTFRGPFRKRRALIPADGYYEWKKTNGRKQPYYFTVRGGEPFAFAGIWETWQGSEGVELRTCAIITTAPNELAAEIHDRMPVILEPESYDPWLDPESETEELLSRLAPYPAERMQAHPVSTHVNRPVNDDERCVVPATV